MSGNLSIDIICGIAAGVIVLCGLVVGSLFDKSCACFWRNLGMKAATEPTPEELAAAAKAGESAGAKATPAPEAPDMTKRAERVAVASNASSNAEGSRASPTNSSSPTNAAAASASASASAATLLGTEGAKS
jgi:hypothetical protein